MRVMGFGFSAPKSPVPGLDVAATVRDGISYRPAAIAS
jgi:hypothetical protein